MRRMLSLFSNVFLVFDLYASFIPWQGKPIHCRSNQSSMRFVFLPLHSHSVYTFFLGMTVFPLSDSVIAKDLDVLPFFDLCSTIMIQVAELHKTQEILGMRMPHVNGSSINPSVVSFCLNDAAWILRTLSQQFPNVHRNVAIVAICGRFGIISGQSSSYHHSAPKFILILQFVCYGIIICNL